jgi:hypothetical protein
VSLYNVAKHEPGDLLIHICSMGYTQLAITDTLQGVHNTTKKLIRKLKSAIQKIILKQLKQK